MKRRKRLLGVWLIITALIIMQLPVSEADAATSASDFKMEGATLVKYRGTEKNVSVPDTVEVIGKGAFEGNTSIELVVIPNSVKQIEAYAFWGCDSLEKVVLGKGLTEVGDFAFTNCQGLSDMSIPENVRSIGIQAFADCVNLKDITIPPEVTGIHETAFDGCSKLVIHCETGSYADKYAKAFYEKQKEMPEYEDISDYPAEEPDNQEPEQSPDETPASTPSPSEDNNLELLGSTAVVGNRAVVFIDNTSPTVHSGESAADVPKETLEPDTLTSGGGVIPKYSIVDGKIVADQAYYRSDKLQNVSLMQGITEIGQFSFARSTLESISMPDSVEAICYGAFYHCDNLDDVILPESIMNVEPKAFSYTSWVNHFLQDAGDEEGDFLISGGVLVAYRGSTADVMIPEETRVIAAEAFLGHTEIESLTLPESLLVVGEGAFEGCTSLKTLTFGHQVQRIKDRAFANCGLTKLSLPESVNELGLRAFDEAVQLSTDSEGITRTYEASAQRLSNEKYRVYGETKGQAGVIVAGMENVSASLTGADREYILSVERVSQSSEMEAAFLRNLKTEVPKDIVLYDLTLSDESSIPLTKLGKQLLTVTIPVPETLKGQELKVVTLDRNGQLEFLESELLMADGVETVQFKTNYLSMVAVYGTGIAYENIRIVNMSAPTEEGSLMQNVLSRPLHSVKWLLSTVLLIAGVCLTVQKGGTNKLLRHKI